MSCRVDEARPRLMPRSLDGQGHELGAASYAEAAVERGDVLANAPPISYVRDLDEYFIANAIATAKLAGTSDAQPAMFAPPPAP